MTCLWSVFSAVLLCACAQAELNPIDLGRLGLHAQEGHISSTYPPNANDTKASRNARVALEYLRPYFTSGMGHIPRLEPYYRQEPLVVNIERRDFRCAIKLSDIRVRGAQQFVMKNLDVYTETDRVDFDVEFPELEMSFVYNVRLHSDEAETHFAARANATFQHVVANLAYDVDKLIGGPLGVIFKINDMSLNVTADDVQYDLRNLLRHRRSVPASTLTQLVVKEVKDDVAHAVVRGLMHDFNSVLTRYSVDQIRQLLLP